MVEDATQASGGAAQAGCAYRSCVRTSESTGRIYQRKLQFGTYYVVRTGILGLTTRLSVDIAEVRRLSEVVFGAEFRLEIGAAIDRLGREAFTTAELQAVCQAPLDHSNNVGRNLKKFAEARLVTYVNGLWHRAESPLWTFCRQWEGSLVAVASEPDPGR